MNIQTSSHSAAAMMTRLVLTLLLAFAGVFTVQAQSIISLNITSPANSDGDSLAAGDYAGAPGARTNNWNNMVTDANWSSSDISLASGTVMDASGTVVSGMSVTFHPAGNGGGVGTYDTGGNANDTKVFKDYNDAFNCSGFSQYGYLDITGIPYATFKIYCYASTSDTPSGAVTTSARGGFFVVTNAPLGAERYYVRTVDDNGNLEPVPDSSGNGYVKSTTTLIPSGGASFTTIQGGNYVVFSSLTNSSTRIWFGALGAGQGVDDLGNTVSDGDGAVRLKVAGFQIVEVPAATATNLYLQSTNLMLHAGDPVGAQLTVLADLDNGTIGEDVTAAPGIAYSVTDPTIAMVSPSGLLTPGTNGTANLIVTYQGISLTNPITVIGPTSLSLSVANTNLFVGNNTTATLYANFSDATNVPVNSFQFTSFSSSGGVTISANGTITAVSAGTFSVTGSYAGLSVSATDVGTVSASAQGTDVLSFNLASPTSQNQMSSGDYAGAPGVRATNWNNLVTDANGSQNDITLTSVMDGAGNAVSGMTVVFHPANNGGGVVNYGSNGGSNDPKVFQDYDDAFGGNGFNNYGYIDIAGIPFTNYVIYCYYEPDSPLRGGFMLITNAPGGAVRCYIKNEDSNGNQIPTPDSSGNNYIQSKTTAIPSGASSWANIDGGNYVEFNAVLTNSSTRIWFGAIGNGNSNIGNQDGVDDLGNYPTGGDSIVRFKLCGFQIVQAQAVVAPLTVSVTPTNATALAGSSATFTAVPFGGSGVYTYQWYQVGVGSLAGQTNSTLVLNGVTTNMNNDSYYVAVNDGSTTVDSGNATLTVQSPQYGQILFDSFEPPTSTDVSVSQAVNASGNIDWNVTGFSYAYLYLASVLGFDTNQPGITGVNGQIIEGNGAGSFTKNLGIPFQPNTIYTVDVAGGSDTGDMTFGLQSSVSGSLPGATQGLIHESLLSPGEFVYASTAGSGVGNVFTFTTGFSVPSGDVVCYINSAGGDIYADSFTVTTVPVPTQPLTATISPTNADVVVGSTVTFAVTASGGNGTGTYQWYEMGVGSLAGQTNATLVFSDVTTNLTGTYYASAYDGSNTVNSANATLTVTPSLAQVLNAPYAPGLPVDANPAHWNGLGATSLYMDTTGITNGSPRPPGDLGVTMQYAWDYTNLYILVQENTNYVTAGSQLEGPDEATYQANPWSFDTIAFWMDLQNTCGTTINGALVTKGNADFQPWFGFSSMDLTNLFYARANNSGNMDLAGLAHAKIATSGTFTNHNRVIEVAIAWADVAADVATISQPGGNLLAAVGQGYKFGSEPLLIYNNYNVQCFVGGTNNPSNPWSPPSGVDAYSVDVQLVMAAAPSLQATLEGGQMVIRWPVTAAGYSLYTSPALGAGANWTQVTSPSPVVDPNDSTKMKWTGAVSGTQAFYRLQPN